MYEMMSRQAPALKDYVTVWGYKERLQKWHFLYNICETYECFAELYPEANIKRLKFATLRPVNVLLQKDTASDSCLKHCTRSINLFQFVQVSFVDAFVCSSSSSYCMLHYCEHCKDIIEKWLHGFE